MKYLNFFLAALFLLFAAVQYNDPDPFAWMAMYGYIGVVSIFAGLGRYNRYVLYVGLAATLIWMAILIPEFVSWVRMGMPTITGSMKAESPHVEYTREFLGLLICGLAFVFYLRQSGKVNKSEG